VMRHKELLSAWTSPRYPSDHELYDFVTGLTTSVKRRDELASMTLNRFH